MYLETCSNIEISLLESNMISTNIYHDALVCQRLYPSISIHNACLDGFIYL